MKPLQADEEQADFARDQPPDFLLQGKSSEDGRGARPRSRWDRANGTSAPGTEAKEVPRPVAEDEESPANSLARLMPPDEFENLTNTGGLSSEPKLPEYLELWSRPPSEVDVVAIASVRSRLVSISGLIRTAAPWELSVIQDGFSAPGQRAWGHLIEMIRAANSAAADAREAYLDGATFCTADLPVKTRDLSEILDYLEAKGRLATPVLLRRRSWRLIRERCSRRGHRPNSEEEYAAIMPLLRLHLRRLELVEQWERHASSEGGLNINDLGARPEETLREFVPRLKLLIAWASDAWEPIIEELTTLGFIWSAFEQVLPPIVAENARLWRIVQACEIHLPWLLTDRIREYKIGELRDELDWIARGVESGTRWTEPQRQLLSDLQLAVQEEDYDTYRWSYNRLRASSNGQVIAIHSVQHTPSRGTDYSR